MNLNTGQGMLFLPARRAGYLFLLGLILLLIGAGSLGLYQASQAALGPVFLAWLLPGLAAVVLTPMLGYRLYGLRSAQYLLERDGLMLRWGLRLEQIPMNEIQWVRPQDELAAPLPLPVTRMPGAVLGVRQLSGAARQAGWKTVEYLASQSSRLLLIGTTERVYAISPEDRDGFLYTYQRLAELGSLTPLAGRSVYPAILVGRVWANRPARVLVLAGLILSLGLLAWVSLVIPGREQVHLGFLASGAPGDLAPAVQLLLLPVLNGAIVLFNLFSGLFFFRRPETQAYAYLLWGSSAFCSILFLLGTWFILQAG